MTSVSEMTAPLPTLALITGKVDFQKFYNCRVAKEILPKHYCEAGTNWLNQMTIIGIALGDPEVHLCFAGDDFGIEVNGTELREVGIAMAMLEELKAEGIVTGYSLLFTDDEQMFPILG